METGIEAELVKSGKDAYLNTLDKLVQGLSNIIQDRELAREPMRIYFQANLILSMLPGEKKRKEARAELQKLIDERTTMRQAENPNKPLTEDEKTWIIAQSSLNVIGQIADFQNSLLGMTREKRIGIV